MRKFNVGDSVKVINGDGFYSWHIGKTGLIKDIVEDSLYPIMVSFHDGTIDCGDPSGLELLDKVRLNERKIEEDCEMDKFEVVDILY